MSPPNLVYTGRDAWKNSNECWRQIVLMEYLGRQIIDQQTPKLFLLSLGPHGLGKSFLLNKLFDEYEARCLAAWQAGGCDPRHMHIDEDGNNVWRKPIARDIGGLVTPKEFYMTAHDHKVRGMGLVLDDPSRHKQVMEMIHHGTDSEKGNIIKYAPAKAPFREIEGEDGEIKRIPYPKRFAYKGSLFINDNAKPDSAEYKKYYTAPLRSRAHGIVVFPFHDTVKGRQDIITYLFNLLPAMAYGFIKREHLPNVTPKQALPIISDVRDYFWKHQNESPEPSFRTIEKLLTERIVAGNLNQPNAMNIMRTG